MKKAISLLLILSILIVIAGGFYLYQFGESPSSSDRVNFELVRGMHSDEISISLEKSGAIKSSKAFYWFGKISGNWNGIKSAEYEIPAKSTPNQIFKILKSGIGIQRALLIKEGDNLYQIAEAMEAAGIGTSKENVQILKSNDFIKSLGLSEDGIKTLEGYLYPNTYFYDKRDKPESIIRKMVIAFLKNWTDELSERAKIFGFTRKQVITLASMIEKETGAGQERPIISSVFHNRLNKKMRLQSDPTTIYGIWENYSGNLHKSDLLNYTDYNTYTVPALPIGPISNPHSESIRAALYPAETDYLFFVSRNDGTHVFSHTYAEHSSWVKKLQMDPSAREGKSWRDLKDSAEKKSN